MFIIRFPQASVNLISELRKVTQPEQMQTLITAALRATDLAAFEQALHQMVNGKQNGQ